MQSRYGRAIRIESLNDEHVFTLETQDATLPLEEVVRAFGLVEYQAFIDRCTAAQLRVLAPIAAE
jgi:hypothetical protein